MTDATNNKADALRVQALQLLNEAQALDGQMLYGIAHVHEYGCAVYLTFSKDAPTQAEAEDMLQSEFEEDRGEVLYIDQISTKSICGVSELAETVR